MTRVAKHPIASRQRCLHFLSVSCYAPPATLPADRGGICGPGRRGPQDSYPTPARHQCQRGGETEKKRIQGLHNLDLLQTLRFCRPWALLRPDVSIGVHKVTDIRATRCLCSAMCDNPQCRRAPHEDGGHPVLPLVWSVDPVAQAARPVMLAARIPVVASREAWKGAKC